MTLQKFEKLLRQEVANGNVNITELTIETDNLCLKRADLAARFGVSPQYVSKLLSGIEKSTSTFDIIFAIKGGFPVKEILRLREQRF